MSNRLLWFITLPWTDVPKIHIEQDKTQAKASLERLLSMPNTRSASYYTIGAAAIQIGHNSQNVSVFLGSTSCYTVYAAELSGILVALHMAAANRSISQTVLIFSDNQSALQSIGRPGTTSGQIIIWDILDVIQKLRARRIEIQFYWVPAHTGIAGNEKADKVAKESTGWRTQTKRHGRQIEINADKTAYQIQIPPLKAAIRATHRQQIYECWKTSWNNEIKGKDLRILVTQPSKKDLMIHTKLKKPQSSLLVQMRKEKIGLRSFLYTRKIIEDKRCECGYFADCSTCSGGVSKI